MYTVQYRGIFDSQFKQKKIRPCLPPEAALIGEALPISRLDRVLSHIGRGVCRLQQAVAAAQTAALAAAQAAAQAAALTAALAAALTAAGRHDDCKGGGGGLREPGITAEEILTAAWESVAVHTAASPGKQLAWQETCPSSSPPPPHPPHNSVFTSTTEAAGGWWGGGELTN
jgi:hypothetical protein